MRSPRAYRSRPFGDLRLEGGLEEKRDSEPGYLLEDVAELTAGAEELIELGTDALGGGYSS
jgi:hypothetical protein